MKRKNNSRLALRLTESAMMIAVATVLSLIKPAELPYGGSVTLASALPLVLISYRYGTPWGILCGLVHGTVQCILGASVLSYVTGAFSAVTVILMDFVVAFGVIGLSGVFRGKLGTQRREIVTGAVLASALRYICHVISGYAVWRDISIPIAGAISFSFIYNATYMIPEALILAVTAAYLSSVMDFSGERFKPLSRDIHTGEKKSGKRTVLNVITGAVICASLVYSISAVFSVLQNGETGKFDITGISAAPWGVITVLLAVSAVLTAVNFLIRGKDRSGKRG